MSRLVLLDPNACTDSPLYQEALRNRERDQALEEMAREAMAATPEQRAARNRRMRMIFLFPQVREAHFDPPELCAHCGQQATRDLVLFEWPDRRGVSLPICDQPACEDATAARQDEIMAECGFTP